MTTELALLLDIGSAWAKAGVIGRSRGRWRLVAHAAQPTSWGARALRQALVEQLEAAGDRRLAGRYDDLIGAANRIECHSPRRQGRLALVAVSRELSGSAARRAAESAGWEVAPIVSLDDGKSLADRLRTLQSAEPDAWLAVGGF
ncbi:MAG TPA: glutamate mutase L, partial [Candidatus Limnocylindria bacterium]